MNFVKTAGRKLISRVLAPELAQLRSAQTKTRIAVGALAATVTANPAASPSDAEFSAFSQFGEDGIIEYIVTKGSISPQSFVEIGVEDYSEANTRFLAEHRGWRGLIIDSNPTLQAALENTNLHWRRQVFARSAFLTRENALDHMHGFDGQYGLGLLSIDIDGVDYWVLAALLELRPALIIVEYNSLFGPKQPVSVPYEASFDRRDNAFHNVYYGASLAAFVDLLRPVGYSLICCTTAGNNAFFVRDDCLGELQGTSTTAAYRPRRFSEHRNSDGELTGLTDVEAQLRTIRTLPLIDVRTGRTTTVETALIR